MITWNYVEPMHNEMSVEEFEADYGVTLPADYKALVRRYNNGYPSRRMFRLPNGEACRMSHLYSFNREDLENMWDFNSADDLEAGYVAFANDPFGNQIGFRLTDHAVVFADLDTGEVVEVAADFQSFLNGLEQGK